MKNADPLTILTVIVGLGLLLVLGRFAVTGELSEGLLGVMATIIGGLVTALSNRKKDKDKDGGADGS
ncbi:hypothetical protein DEIPH_ctg063orf0003 [Deinococcus phoenicis]|uniref:Uncharacterized protein n=1 Tax=Deinococcus phoenicis TaxID=1476583 RepID=A0A016QMB8_9DEIO|nr:hypothetical protein [Deinococcus phoenicis]EYB66924.1 hypothetical protein DEIPH_ctg063orf0003 [Deinococcus phoenicis]